MVKAQAPIVAQLENMRKSGNYNKNITTNNNNSRKASITINVKYDGQEQVAREIKNTLWRMGFT